MDRYSRTYMVTDEQIHELKLCMTILVGYSQLLAHEHEKLGLKAPRLLQYTDALQTHTKALTALIRSITDEDGMHTGDGRRQDD